MIIRILNRRYTSVVLPAMMRIGLWCKIFSMNWHPITETTFVLRRKCFSRLWSTHGSINQAYLLPQGGSCADFQFDGSYSTTPQRGRSRNTSWKFFPFVPDLDQTSRKRRGDFPADGERGAIFRQGCHPGWHEKSIHESWLIPCIKWEAWLTFSWYKYIITIEAQRRRAYSIQVFHYFPNSTSQAGIFAVVHVLFQFLLTNHCAFIFHNSAACHCRELPAPWKSSPASKMRWWSSR